MGTLAGDGVARLLILYFTYGRSMPPERLTAIESYNEHLHRIVKKSMNEVEGRRINMVIAIFDLMRSPIET